MEHAIHAAAHRTALRSSPSTYVYLLGLYLGDGCISTHPRGVYRLRLTLDAAYPKIIADAAQALTSVMPSNRWQGPATWMRRGFLLLQGLALRVPSAWPGEEASSANRALGLVGRSGSGSTHLLTEGSSIRRGVGSRIQGEAGATRAIPSRTYPKTSAGSHGCLRSDELALDVCGANDLCVPQGRRREAGPVRRAQGLTNWSCSWRGNRGASELGSRLRTACS